jgi:hypothetical protein
MMNFHTLDRHLDYELNESGIDTFVTALNITRILDKLVVVPETVITNYGFPTVNYLMVSINVESVYDHYSGGYDYEVDYKLDGYLDKDFKPKKITKK